MGMEERLAQPLWKKIENLIPRFIICTMNKDFRKKWKWPGIDPETGLFKEKKVNKLAKMENEKKAQAAPSGGGLLGGGFGKKLQNSLFSKLEDFVSNKALEQVVESPKKPAE
jgi:hypothetical protein